MSADLVSLAGPYLGLTRGQAGAAVLDSLLRQGLYREEVEQEEEVLWSTFRDVVSIKDVRDITREEGQVNLRKPVLIVSTGKDKQNVSISANVGMEACDNKVIDTVGGRTGGFCTGCDACERDMHLPRAEQVYYLNMGADQVQEHFEEMRQRMGGEEHTRAEDVVIPSKRNDVRTRLGTKHAPLTTQWEHTKV